MPISQLPPGTPSKICGPDNEEDNSEFNSNNTNQFVCCGLFDYHHKKEFKNKISQPTLPPCRAASPAPQLEYNCEMTPIHNKHNLQIMQDSEQMNAQNPHLGPEEPEEPPAPRVESELKEYNDIEVEATLERSPCNNIIISPGNSRVQYHNSPLIICGNFNKL